MDLKLELVADDVTELRATLVSRSAEVSEVDHQEWGDFLHLADPDGNRWDIQQLPDRSA